MHLTPAFDKTDFSNSFAITGSGVSTYDLTASSVNASGTSAYTGGGETVALTGLQWVGCNGINPYQAGLTVQRVDLTVTAASSTPEPGTIVLLGAGLATLLVSRRRRPRTS